jgi:hypothetical protein
MNVEESTGDRVLALLGWALCGVIILWVGIELCT